MKKILALLIGLIITVTSSNAGEINSELLSNASKKISEFTSNLIPGEGYSEVSIDLRENSSPDFSILGVREIKPIEDGTVFAQFSLFNTEANTGSGGDERYIGNIGFGQRKLLNNNTLMVGVNSFFDLDIENEHKRGSVGIEIRNAVVDFNLNNYVALADNETENVLDGYDYQLSSQIPYLHWANVYANSYKWAGESRDDIAGLKLGSEMALTSNFSFEFAYDDKDKKGLSDEWYYKLQFVHPPRENGPTAMNDGVSDTAWNENRDMSGELLSKVKRQNKIMIEFKGTSTISRTD